MGRWTDLAEWRGPTDNQSGAMVEQRGMVIHIAEGSYEGTISWQKNPSTDVSSHFVVDYNGKIAQVVDTDITAWTQRAGNGHWVSVENAGFTPNALTTQQIEANAKLLAKGHLIYGWALKITTSPTGLGLGHHSMGTNGHSVPTDTWTGATWGHEDCPGPNIINQKSAILQRAIQILNGDLGVEDMTEVMFVRFSDDPNPMQVWACTGFQRWRVLTTSACGFANGSAEQNNWLAGTKAAGNAPMSTGQIYQPNFLGNMSVKNGGKCFISSGDKNAWGAEVGGAVANVVLSPEDLAAIEAAAEAGAQAGSPTQDELKQAAFEGAQKAEDE